MNGGSMKVIASKIMGDIMPYDCWVISIDQVNFMGDKVEKVLKINNKSSDTVYSFVTGYLQAMVDKGANIDKVQVSIELVSNDGRFTEVMPSPKFTVESIDDIEPASWAKIRI